MRAGQSLADVRERCEVKKSDHRHRRLLRTRRERPRGYTAAEKCDEFPPPHGVDPKAKDHGTKYSRCWWGGSVARIAIKSGPLMSGDEVDALIARA